VENQKPKIEETVAALSAESRSFRARLARWFKARGRDLPWRRTQDPYAIMVSEFMLQQTQVATVLDYYRRWLERFPDFATLAAATEDDVLHAWQGLGYYSRARNLHRAAQAIHAQYGGRPPNDPALLTALPGVGRYTAGAIATFAFDRPVPIIDANIARVIARLLDLQEPIDTTRGSEILWNAAAMLLPKERGRLHNSALMELGALVCSPRNPSCLLCPVRVHCRTQSPESLPRKKPRRKTVSLTEDCAWIVHKGRLLLEQQTGPRWRGLWKLPPLTERDAKPKLLLSFDYPFTHHRVTLSVFTASKPPVLSPSQQWIPLSEVSAIALASPHRRAIQRLAAS
jgi:A/G-specific adenine glycosylase